MIISTRDKSYCYIGETICLKQIFLNHNQGFGSSSTRAEYLRPFALMAYICGCGQRKILREQIEYQWKVSRDYLIENGNSDPREWEKIGQHVIDNLNYTNYGIEKTDLNLILCFRN